MGMRDAPPAPVTSMLVGTHFVFINAMQVPGYEIAGCSCGWNSGLRSPGNAWGAAYQHKIDRERQVSLGEVRSHSEYEAIGA